LGEDRAEGKRRHRGIDFASTYLEPVRAVADGRVKLAGLDRPRGGPINLDPEAAQEVRRRKMGPGGLFVMIQHAEGLTSAYMHLARYTVKAGQQIKAGQLIGHVGRSGTKDSGPHLHFELRHGGHHIDPLPHLEAYVFAPLDTYVGRRIAAEQRRLRRRRRIRRWRKRKAARAAARRAATKDASATPHKAPAN
jgi:murein DD-endopeptidase MepM/ murein hydrolase activator NlpD